MLTLESDTVITVEVWQTLQFCEWMDKGLPPISGGALDQDQWFLDACLFVSAETVKIAAEGLNDGVRSK